MYDNEIKLNNFIQNIEILIRYHEGNSTDFIKELCQLIVKHYGVGIAINTLLYLTTIKSNQKTETIKDLKSTLNIANMNYGKKIGVKNVIFFAPQFCAEFKDGKFPSSASQITKKFYSDFTKFWKKYTEKNPDWKEWARNHNYNALLEL